MFRLNGSFAVGNQPVDVVTGDFDGDGNLDLAVANGGSAGAAAISVLLGDGAGGFGAATTFAAGNAGRALVTADFNGDGDLDLAAANAGGDTVSVLLGDGSGAFGAPTNVPAGAGGGLAVADLNGGGGLDLAVPDRDNDVLNLLLGDGSGGFATSAGSPFAAGDWPVGVAAGNLDGDGDVDLVVTNQVANTVSVMLNDGAGGFSTSTLSTANGPAFAALGDLDGDGDLDLVVSSIGDVGTGTLSVRLGNGDGTFGAATNTVVGDNPWTLALADLDGDGDLDAAVASLGADQLTVLTGDGAGGWAGVTTFAVANARGVAVGDFDEDGRPDLAVGSAIVAGTVSILLNTGLEITADAPSAPEGNAGTTTFTFTVTRYGSTLGAVSADWAVTGFGGGPADAADFQGGVLPSGTVSFGAGQATQTITVTVVGEAAIEADEAFQVTLSNPTGIVIGAATAQAVIVDDDTPRPRIVPSVGGEGNDLAVLSDHADTYQGGAGDDLVAGDGGNDSLHGNTGADTIYGGAGEDTVHGGQGDDVLFGDDGADVLFGDKADDMIHGGRGDDIVDGGEGSDALAGGQGNDVIRGGDGADLLTGDRGDDTLVGGAGPDVFRIVSGGGADIVVDFDAAEGDRVQVVGSYTVRQAGPDVIVELQDGSLTLQQVQLSSLQGGWIFG